MSRRAADPFFSAVVPVFNESALINKFLTALAEKLSSFTSRFELVVVDDGSSDETVDIVKGLIGTLPVKLLEFSRNFGKEKAITAGLDHAHGDAVIIIDADFQHPLEVIDAFVDKWKLGYDNVYGVRDRHDQTWLNRFFAKHFYKVNRYLMSVDLPPDAGDFRLLDHKVVMAIRALPESNRFMKGLYAWVGFRGIGIPYQVAVRMEGKSRFNFFKLWGLAITGMTSFSDWPLRVWSLVGMVISAFSVIYGIWVVLDTLVFGASVPGWATLAVAVMFLGGVQLISIGVVAEYIARIFREVKQRPQYLIAEKHGFGDD